VCLHEVEHPLVEGVKHDNQHEKEEVGVQVVNHDRGNMSYHVQFFVKIGLQAFTIGHKTGSAKCKSVRKPHSNLLDTPVALTGAPK
jgi:hypothetical protein